MVFQDRCCTQPWLVQNWQWHQQYENQTFVSWSPVLSCFTGSIYTTKIDGVVCPPNISETVASRLMKLTHRPRIASTMMKLISKPILPPILLISVKTIQRIVADPKRKLSPPFVSADPVPSLGHLATRLQAKCCRYLLCFAIIQSGWPRPEPRVRVKRFSQSEFSSTTAAVARTTFRLDRFRNHSNFAWFTFVYAGNMLFCVMNIFTSR